MMARLTFQLAGLLAWALAVAAQNDADGGYFAEVGAHQIHVGYDKVPLMRRDAAIDRAALKVDYAEMPPGGITGGMPANDTDDDSEANTTTGETDPADLVYGHVEGLMVLISKNHSDEFIFNGGAQQSIECAIAAVAKTGCENVQGGFSLDEHDETAFLTTEGLKAAVDELTKDAVDMDVDKDLAKYQGRLTRSAKVQPFDAPDDGQLNKCTVGFTIKILQSKVAAARNWLKELSLADKAAEFVDDIRIKMEKRDLRPHGMEIQNVWIVEGDGDYSSLPASIKHLIPAPNVAIPTPAPLGTP